jgi:hypothetical protein
VALGLVTGFDLAGFLGAGVRRTARPVCRRDPGRTLRFVNSSSSEARPDTSTSSSELGTSKRSRVVCRRLRGRRACS